jgi:hypothetical protein
MRSASTPIGCRLSTRHRGRSACDGTSCSENLTVDPSVMVTMMLTRPTQPPALVRSHLIRPPGAGRSRSMPSAAPSARANKVVRSTQTGLPSGAALIGLPARSFERTCEEYVPTAVRAGPLRPRAVRRPGTRSSRRRRRPASGRELCRVAPGPLDGRSCGGARSGFGPSPPSPRSW